MIYVFVCLANLFVKHDAVYRGFSSYINHLLCASEDINFLLVSLPVWLAVLKFCLFHIVRFCFSTTTTYNDYESNFGLKPRKIPMTRNT